VPDGRHADRAARATYFRARAADALYGQSDGSQPRRWHRTSGAAAAAIQGDSTVLAVELLRLPRYARSTPAESRYLCVLHLALDFGDLCVPRISSTALTSRVAIRAAGRDDHRSCACGSRFS
jgi:hypothetical protein